MLMRVTDEGLVVELFDLPGRGLFDADGRPAPVLEALLRAVGTAFGYAENQVAIKSFVRAVPVVLAQPRRFETSIARAESVRGLLSGRIAPSRIQRVSGHGDRVPATADATELRNNRVELVLLR
jgi:chemotaxis protein MotB